MTRAERAEMQERQQALHEAGIILFRPESGWSVPRSTRSPQSVSLLEWVGWALWVGWSWAPAVADALLAAVLCLVTLALCYGVLWLVTP